MRRTMLLVAVICGICFLPFGVQARLVVNEVLSNEPGGSTGLEWFELYNNSDLPVDLNLYQFTAGANTFPINAVMPAHGFLIVCRKLVGTPVNPGFETYWGNNSAVWGDAPTENYPVIEISFSLANAGGAVVVSLIGTVESSIAWTSSGADGVSWERERPGSDVIKQSISPYGSTPGGINSWTPLAFDLSLDSVVVEPVAGSARLTFIITSRSLNRYIGGQLAIFYIDPTDTLRVDSQLALIALPDIDTGFTTLVTEQYQLTGTYQKLGAALAGDDRNYNNRKNFAAPGSEFPPIILSEFLANPQGSAQTEWVEVKNREDTVVSFTGWGLGDSTQLSSTPIAPLTIQPHDYLVLAEDTAAFRASYAGFTGTLVPLSPWPSLNNSGDLLRLVDSFGLEADRFEYRDLYDSNLTWARAEGSDTRWGRSVDTGGTPGSINSVRFAPTGNALRVTVLPQIFSPDADGVDDTTVIAVEGPPADGFTLKIYDVQGRVVRTFERGAIDLAPSYIWNGHDDNGGRLPTGIYILFVEAQGVESIKKTIVVAR